VDTIAIHPSKKTLTFWNGLKEERRRNRGGLGGRAVFTTKTVNRFRLNMMDTERDRNPRVIVERVTNEDIFYRSGTQMRSLHRHNALREGRGPDWTRLYIYIKKWKGWTEIKLLP